MNIKVKVKLIKALWGMEGSLESQFAKVAEAGYEGVESPLPSKEDERLFRELMEKYDLDYVAMVFTDGDDHFASFKDQVSRAAKFHPVSITSHSVRDRAPLNKQIEFFKNAIKFEREIGIPVGHETHRGRALYNPWDTVHILEEVPELKLTADFSHWCCVTESTLEPHEDLLKQALPRVQHIHGRIGYAQGPQVPDPRAPEYRHELLRHFEWWEQIVQDHKRKGLDSITFTPEFGPPGYLHTLPFTNQPVANLWEVCLWTGTTFKQKMEG